MGQIVVIVDVIDMSTTLEGAMDAGAVAVLGASPQGVKAPVPLNPESVGWLAGRLAQEKGAGIVVVTEPRVGPEEKRLEAAGPVLRGVRTVGGRVIGVVPNLGKETAHLVDFAGKVVVAVTSAGGTAFDAALQAGGEVVTGTVARTLGLKGPEPAKRAARRAVTLARDRGKGIAVVAASANAWEDVLGAQCIARYIYEERFR
ncbi:hypothetical protein SY88_07105 [Clostridiales bacterium PH28_bin88]|nr:hypothetical protein SY88_07105 [Clostridiales bacterium PH28_bin88]